MSLTISIYEKSLFARIAAWRLGVGSVAIVFRNTIYLHNTTRVDFLANKQWLCHELQHVVQYRKMGTIKFLFYYFIYFLKYGYRNNPLEIEARENEGNQKLLINLKIKKK